MDKNKIRSVVKRIANDSEILRELKDDPSQIARRFELSGEDAEALKRANIFLVARLPQAVTSTFTFTTGSTITPG